jgi:curved DNA-binding protein
MEYKDYYQILGVDRNADEKVIKRAYRRLARQFHPDVNPNDRNAEDHFKEINEAYEVLGDPDKRAKYDQVGASWQQWQRRGRDPSHFDWSQWTTGAPGGVRVEWGGDLGDLFGGAGTDMFSDFFQAIFGSMGGAGRTDRIRTTGGGFQRTATQRGSDAEASVEITLEEAYHGATRILERDGQRIRVRIPPGAHSGSRVRVAGKGHAGYGGIPAGDLYLHIEVAPHPTFTVEQNNLRCEVPIDIYTAVLGGQATVPTPDGHVSLSIPSGTNSGVTFRLRGKGMPAPRTPDQRGDILATVHIQVPQQLTSRERELFEELARLRQRGEKSNQNEDDRNAKL